MIELVLYTTLTCAQTDEIILRMQSNENISNALKTELVEVMKESNPDCYVDIKPLTDDWDAND